MKKNNKNIKFIYAEDITHLQYIGGYVNVAYFDARFGVREDESEIRQFILDKINELDTDALFSLIFGATYDEAAGLEYNKQEALLV